MNSPCITARGKATTTLTMEEIAGEVNRRTEHAAKRIRAVYSEKRVKVIEDMENVCQRFNGSNYEIFYKPLGRSIKYCATYWARQANRAGLRLSEDDFESVMWEEAWKVIDQGHGPDFYFLEALELRFKSRALDLLRWARRKRRVHDLTALPLPDFFADTYSDPFTSNLQDDVANRELISQMLRDSSLTDQERRLLLFLYQNPDASLQDIADHLGVPHRQTAKRMIDKVRKKLHSYSSAC